MVARKGLPLMIMWACVTAHPLGMGGCSDPLMPSLRLMSSKMCDYYTVQIGSSKENLGAVSKRKWLLVHVPQGTSQLKQHPMGTLVSIFHIVLKNVLIRILSYLALQLPPLPTQGIDSSLMSKLEFTGTLILPNYVYVYKAELLGQEQPHVSFGK